MTSTTALQPPADASDGVAELLQHWPRAPLTVVATGLPAALVEDLVLKAINETGRCSLGELAARVGLTIPVVEEVVHQLSRQGYVEARPGSHGAGRGYSTLAHQFDLTEHGQRRLGHALAHSRYVGVAPLPVEQHVELARIQSLRRKPIALAQLERALEPFVLQPAVRSGLTRAFHAGRPALLYGDTGNGKTSILDAYGRSFGDPILIPAALYAHGQTIRVYDSALHESVAGERGVGPAEQLLDPRWLPVRRPVVFLGGELVAQHLELVYDEARGVYQAPPQMKAQDGLLVIDDFGRQRIRPDDLLNRWIVPLERGYDRLTLETGEALTIPFEVCVLFSTNLSPSDLADEALLRRIPYKVHVPSPGASELAEIARRECLHRGIACDESGIQQLVRCLFRPGRPAPKAVFPRDVLSIIEDGARIQGCDAALSPEAIADACELYFVGESS